MAERVYIERMGQGVEAVGHLADGKTVFVPYAAPGDVLDLEITEDKSHFARARIENIVESSPHRVAEHWHEPIAHSLAPWQHFSYEAQLEAKRANVVSNLQRIGGLPNDVAKELVKDTLGSKRQWGYRNKLEFAAASNDQGRFALGFTEEGSHEITSCDRCPLAHRSIERAGRAIQGALRYLQGSGDLGIFRVGVRSSLRTGETELALWTPPSSFPRSQAVATLSSAVKSTSIVRVLASPGKARKVKKVEVLSGKGSWSEQMLGAYFTASAPSFFQVNTAQAEKLVRFVVEQLGGGFSEGGPRGLDGLSIADLYAGGGTFSIPMALAGADVTAVEAEGSTVRDLRRNAEHNEVYVDVVGGDAARELSSLGRLDALVVDPPRAGLAEGVPRDIAATNPRKLIYISCNPATWARDVKRLREQGFELEAVQPVDMFPQTYHVEVASSFVWRH